MSVGVGDFSTWYDEVHPRVLGVLRGVSGEADVAAEATDEAFARAYARWKRVAAMDSPDGWVYRVALNVLRRRLRRRSREAPAEEMPVRLQWAPEPDHELWATVAQLSTRQRTAVALRYVADLPEAAIAEAMGVTRGTVASTLADARARLRVALGEPAPEATVVGDERTGPNGTPGGER